MKISGGENETDLKVSDFYAAIFRLGKIVLFENPPPMKKESENAVNI